RSFLSMRRVVVWLATAAAYVFLRRAALHSGWIVDGVPLMLPGLGVGVAAVQLGGPWLASAFLVAGIVEGFAEGLSPLAALLFGVTVSGTAIAYAAIRPARLWRQGERAADTL